MKIDDLVIKRTIHAPLKQVWEAWTKPELIKGWWGPNGFTIPSIQMDFRVGGKFLNAMRSPEGKDYWSTGKILEIQPMKRIVMTDSFADEKGNVILAGEYGMDGDWPEEMLVTVNFEQDSPNTTSFTLVYAGIPDEENLKMAKASWNDMFDKLEAILK